MNISIIDTKQKTNICKNVKRLNFCQNGSLIAQDNEKINLLHTYFKEFELLEVEILTTVELNFELKIKNDSFFFLLQGDLTLNYLDADLLLSEKNYVFIADNKQLMKIKSSAHAKLLLISFANSFYVKELPNLFSTQINLATQYILKQFIGLEVKSELELIYIESRLLDLIYLHFTSLISTEPINQDQEKIEEAKSIITENLKNPCSLIELAHQVGLNDFKLKKGFKEQFGTTVFGYLHDLRMEKATHLILSGKRINVVAEEIGYKNTHHFSAAFKKYYGILPSQLNR